MLAWQGRLRLGNTGLRSWFGFLSQEVPWGSTERCTDMMKVVLWENETRIYRITYGCPDGKCTSCKDSSLPVQWAARWLWKERWKQGVARMNSDGEKREFQLAIWKSWNEAFSSFGYSVSERLRRAKTQRRPGELESWGAIIIWLLPLSLQPNFDASAIILNCLWLPEINCFPTSLGLCLVHSFLHFFLNEIIGGRMAPLKISKSSSLGPVICSRRNYADISKVTLPQIWKMILDYLGGPYLITWALESRELSPAGVRETWQKKSEGFGMGDKINSVLPEGGSTETMRRNEGGFWKQRLASGW